MSTKRKTATAKRNTPAAKPARLDPKRAEAMRQTSSAVDELTVARIVRESLREVAGLQTLERESHAIERGEHRARETPPRDIELAVPTGRGRPAELTKSGSKLVEACAAVDALNGRLERSIERLVNINDERLGAIPQPSTNVAADDKGPGMIGALARLIGRAHRLVSTLEDEIGRTAQI